MVYRKGGDPLGPRAAPKHTPRGPATCTRADREKHGELRCHTHQGRPPRRQRRARADHPGEPGHPAVRARQDRHHRGQGQAAASGGGEADHQGEAGRHPRPPRVLTTVRDKGVVHMLFTEIAPTFADRRGWLHPDHQGRSAQGRQRPDGADRARHRVGRGQQEGQRQGQPLRPRRHRPVGRRRHRPPALRPRRARRRNWSATPRSSTRAPRPSRRRATTPPMRRPRSTARVPTGASSRRRASTSRATRTR